MRDMRHDNVSRDTSASQSGSIETTQTPSERPLTRLERRERQIDPLRPDDLHGWRLALQQGREKARQVVALALYAIGYGLLAVVPFMGLVIAGRAAWRLADHLGL